MFSQNNISQSLASLLRLTFLPKAKFNQKWNGPPLWGKS